MQNPDLGEVGEAVALLWKREPSGLAAFSRWIESTLSAYQAQAEYGKRYDEAQAEIQTVRLEYSPWNWRDPPKDRRIVETWRIKQPRGTSQLKIERTVEGVLVDGALISLGKDPDRLDLHPLAVPGGIVTDFQFIRRRTGFFTFDDLVHFTTTLTLQSHLGLRGDILEIGCYYGRSTCVLAKCLREGERLVVCDTFDLEAGEKYRQVPTMEAVRDAIMAFVPDLAPAQLDIRRCLSEQLGLEPTDRFRFVHVDGAHEKETALQDIRLAARHLADGGVIVVDDYMHYEYPGVTLAVDEFLVADPDFRVLYDLNRREEEGRKVYLGRLAAPAGDRSKDGHRAHGS